MKIKLLIVDDCAFMRTAVRHMVKDDPDIVVVGEACDGRAAVRMAENLNPNVITMDVEMPVMDGLTATRIIMERSPRPIIMLSSKTGHGSRTTIEAMQHGAVDFISKQSSFAKLDIVQIDKDLRAKIRYWGTHHLQSASQHQQQPDAGKVRRLGPLAGGYTPEVVVIGVSTGGPAIVPYLLRAMGPLVCPVVIAQHMPALFTEGFAKHLNIFTGVNVLHASEGMALTAGMVAICPGAIDTVLVEPAPGRLVTRFRLDSGEPIHPSVDVLFHSAARLERRVVGVIMTGMGNDGTSGARALAERGCPILAQEPDECIVDSMPSSVIKSGVVNEVLKAEAIGHRLRKWAGTAAELARADQKPRSA